jgi:ABC-type phosphonate transport system ATPase subunit
VTTDPVPEKPLTGLSLRPLARALGTSPRMLLYDDATATLSIAVVRGLLLDRLATGDRARTDAAFVRFSQTG